MRKGYVALTVDADYIPDGGTLPISLPRGSVQDLFGNLPADDIVATSRGEACNGSYLQSPSVSQCQDNVSFTCTYFAVHVVSSVLADPCA